jgi:RNA exonuclease 1
MARRPKRRREERHNHHSSGRRRSHSIDVDMDEALSRAKRPRLFAETFNSSMVRSSPAKAEGDSRGQGRLSTNDSNDGWQVVGSKSRENKRRAGNEKVKYPEVIFHGKNASPIRIADLQNLMLYTLADGVAPNWLAFKYAHHTRKVVVLMAPGLERGIFDGSIDLTGTQAGSVSTTADATHMNAQSRSSNSYSHLELWKQGKPEKESQPWQGNPIAIDKDGLPASIQPIAEIFEEVWPVKAPGDAKMAKMHSPLQAMLISPLPASKADKDHKGPRPPAEERTFHATRTPITAFIHSADELHEAEYPIHPAAFTSIEDAALEAERRRRTNQSTMHGWVDTAVTKSTPTLPPSSQIQAGSITSGLEVYALDCEMVLTTDEVYSLARISVLDWSGTTVLDSFVKPSLPVKNYFTQYSGITPALLSNVTTTLADIQSKLLSLLTPSTILLGHSLESDLNALKLTHPFIIDTSLIYPHPRGPPLRSSLKFLTQKYLRREIQVSNEKGHNSVEDALAVLDLVKLKCEKGPKWGTSEASGEPIFRRLARSLARDNKPRTSAIVDYGTPERGYGKEATVAIGCSSDAEVLQGVCRAVNGDPDGKIVPGGGVDFTWARLRELESWRGWSNNNREYPVVDALHHGSAAEDTIGEMASSSPQDDVQPSKPTLASKAGETVAHIKAIYEALPPCTLFIVYSGTGDPREVGRLQKLQAQYKKEFKVKKWDDLSIKWTDDEEQALRKAVEKARDGCGFLCVK